jgi:fructose-1,6-bisphosphatase/inositol monophosphatase family enzyme
MNDFLQSIIRQAGAIALTYYRQGVTASEKSNRGDVVTEADVAVSAFLVETIHRRYPDHHIASEELENDLNPAPPLALRQRPQTDDD